MSSSNSTLSVDAQNEINTINWIIICMGRWFYPVILLFGVVCNLLNIYVFTRPALQHNSCCLYFLASSVAALIFTMVNLSFRSLQTGYNIDPTIYILSVCKLKFFFSYTWRALTTWYLVLASFDRFLHSSSDINVRAWSSYKIALRATPLALLLVHVAYSHVAVFYVILLPRRTCSIENGIYSIFLGIWHLVTYGTGPPLLMLVFSLLTLRHVRQRRITPMANRLNSVNHHHQKRDRSLLRMVLVQCLVVGFTTSIYAVVQWYTTLTANQMKSSLQLARENLITHLVGSISAIGHSTTFLVFTLTSRLFRQQLIYRRHEQA